MNRSSIPVYGARLRRRHNSEYQSNVHLHRYRHRRFDGPRLRQAQLVSGCGLRSCVRGSRAVITKGCRQRCIYLASPKLIAAIERYIQHRRANDHGTNLGRTDYHGLHANLPLILSRRGYPYSLSKKSRVGESGESTDYWAADSLQAYVTALYRASSSNGTSHSGRRTFATRALANGASIKQVQFLLGHGDIDQTSRYFDVPSADIALAFSEVI
ncbi:tyrosine-type recombinase/integrase [Caballeronia sp.]|uniref:tyrosine-type recombinase/integrase n=1 Tax=Caballeronia sp. TaxID=1931223 RepID=UPI003C580AD4